jgi:hypothetical protein
VARFLPAPAHASPRPGARAGARQAAPAAGCGVAHRRAQSAGGVGHVPKPARGAPRPGGEGVPGARARAAMPLPCEARRWPGLRPGAVGGADVGRAGPLIGANDPRPRGPTAALVWPQAQEAARAELEGRAEAIGWLTGARHPAQLPRGPGAARDERCVGKHGRARPRARRVAHNPRLAPRYAGRKSGGGRLA